MRDFRPLLRELIDRRFGNDREFADAVPVGAPYVSQVLKGHKPPPQKSIEEWANALGLRGAERKTFILAAALANSPAIVHKHLDELEAEIDAQARRVDAIIRRLGDEGSGEAPSRPKR